MAVTYVAKGAFASGTATVSVAVPAGTAYDDLLLLFVETANEVQTVPSGWTEVTNSPQGTGTAATSGAVRITAFYRFATSASEPAASLTGTLDHKAAIMLAFRGVSKSAPFNVTAGSVQAAATTAMSFTGVTTTVANALIVLAAGQDEDLSGTASASTYANAGLTNILERHDQIDSTGRGGGLVILTADRAATGATGATTGTSAASTTHAYLTMALTPAAPGTQSEFAAAADTSSASLSAAHAQSEATSAADTTSAVGSAIGLNAAQAEAASANDASASTFTASQAQSEPASAADASTAALAASHTQTEPATAADAQASSLSAAAAQLEPAAAADQSAATVQSGLNAAQFENAAAADSPSATATQAAQQTEAIAAADASGATLAAAALQLEALVASEGCSAVLTRFSQLLETATPIDISSVQAIGFAVTEDPTAYYRRAAHTVMTTGIHGDANHVMTRIARRRQRRV